VFDGCDGSEPDVKTTGGVGCSGIAGAVNSGTCGWFDFRLIFRFSLRGAIVAGRVWSVGMLYNVML
jgi:hypothetical protein